MSTSLILDVDGQPLPLPPRDPGACPRCQAPKSKRVDVSGFGVVKAWACGNCGYEFRGEA